MTLIRFTWAAALLAGYWLSGISAAAQPNVVILLADDLGWNAVGYHSQWMETPHIDSLARQGIELDRFYVAPMCTPTRAGLLTGRYPIRFGLARSVIPPYRNFGLPVEERSLADALGQAGYASRGIFGKWHLGHHQAKWHPLARGFTHFEGAYNGAIDYFALTRDGQRDWHVGYEPSGQQGYATDLIADGACDFIRQAAAVDAAYFCYVSFNAPHSPLQAKPQDIARFAKGRKPSREDILKAMVWSMDQGIGRILKTIEESGEADNTQVWFMSDNGGAREFKANNQPLRGGKLTTFEGGIRVPACVRWPAQWPGGRKLQNRLGYIDVMPTILASAEVEPDAGQVPGRELDGVNLGGLLAGTDEQLPPRDWYSYHGQSGLDAETMAIHTAQWKLIVTGPDIRAGQITPEHQLWLYSLPEDLLEKRSRAAEHPQVVQELFDKLVIHRRLEPANGVPPYSEGSQGFTPWKDWRIAPPTP